MPTPLHMLPLSAGHLSEVARPLEDFVWMNTNYKYGYSDPVYMAALNRDLPQGLIGGVRENPTVGVPNSTAANPKPTWPWGSGLSWFRDVVDREKHSWMRGRRVVSNLAAASVYEGPEGQQYREEIWGDNIRWRIHQASLPFPDADGVAGWLHPNEPDNTAMTYSDFLRDNPANAPEVAMDRNILLAKMVWQELRGGPHVYRSGPHPGFLLGPTMSRPAKNPTALGGTGDQFSIWQLLTRNNGEILSYFDGIASNQHQVHSRIEGFEGAPPNDNLPSFYHAWTAMQAANQARIATGLGEKLMPLCTTEAGMKHDAYFGDYVDHVALRAFKTGTEFCMMHWWGLSLWTIFSYGKTGVGVPDFDYTDPPDTLPKADWPILLDIVDYRKYGIDDFSSDIPAKDWQDFNKPYSWAVHFPQEYTPPVGLTSGNPAPGFWGRVTFPGGRIDMAAGGRNLVYRPVHLRSMRPHRLSVDVQTTSAVRLRARGFDKLNGLAEKSVRSTSAAWQTIDVVFTPRQHEVNNLPNPCYVLFCLDHDGIGTASFRNPRITVL